MRREKGGTDMWCPRCRKIRTCEATSSANLSGSHLSGTYYFERKQQLQSPEYRDINWFQRGRICLECDYNFVTIELEYEFLTELIKHRKNFSYLEKRIRELISESKKLSESQTKLLETLLDLL